MGLEWVWGLLQPGFVRWARLLHKTTLTTAIKHWLPKLLIYQSETFLLEWFKRVVISYSQQSLCCLLLRTVLLWDVTMFIVLSCFFLSWWLLSIFFYQAIICILCVLSDAGASDTSHIKGYLCVCVCRVEERKINMCWVSRWLQTVKFFSLVCDACLCLMFSVSVCCHSSVFMLAVIVALSVTWPDMLFHVDVCPRQYTVMHCIVVRSIVQIPAIFLVRLLILVNDFESVPI